MKKICVRRKIRAYSDDYQRIMNKKKFIWLNIKPTPYVRRTNYHCSYVVLMLF